MSSHNWNSPGGEVKPAHVRMRVQPAIVVVCRCMNTIMRGETGEDLQNWTKSASNETVFSALRPVSTLAGTRGEED